jgi:hypothetical protein
MLASSVQCASLAGECVPKSPEDTAAVLLNCDFRPSFIAQLGKLTQQVSLVIVDACRGLDQQCYSELTAPTPPQPRNAFAVDSDSGAGLGPGWNRDAHGSGVRR